jgi:hypothetical protein
MKIIKKIIKCFYQSCKATVEIDEPDIPQASGGANVLAAGATFGHAQYQRVPFLARDEHRLSGRPWLCPYHEAMTSATLSLTDHEEKQRQMLVAQLRIGRMTKRENGWYEQAPPAPVPKRIIREDNGDIRPDGLMMRWWTQEEMIAALTPDAPPEASGYTVTIKDPPPGVAPDTDEASEL